ncbi:MAG: tetraacyldisaccharide 4'-kinase [Lysobacterales bacterium]|jgi:tetraacyldisaccharide 4'-kinase
MRSDTEFKLNDIWYGGKSPPAWLRGLVPLYRAANRADRWWKERHRPEGIGPACVIVVGNITVGGSGKTPLVIRLCQVLREAGFRPGVVSRGYGRKGRGLRLVSPASDPGTVGDEPLLIARRAGVPVVVSSDRCEAARVLVRKGVNVVVSDDGLQHYRLPRDIEICVVDGSRGFGNGRLLPAGPLRESLKRLEHVDHVVVNGDPQALPDGVEAIGMNLAAGVLRSLNGTQSWRLSQFSGCRVNAVAGIANPDRFFSLLSQSRIKAIEYPFPDHHVYSSGDFEPMDHDLPILMTEKDAVKCVALDLDNAWVLSVDALLPTEWESAVVAAVVDTLDRRRRKA